MQKKVETSRHLLANALLKLPRRDLDMLLMSDVVDGDKSREMELEQAQQNDRAFNED